MKKFTLYVLAALLSLNLQSCEESKGLAGKPGDVLIVMNSEDWKSTLGEIVRETMKEDYPMLPQCEARFKLSNVSHSSFSDMFQDYRNIVVFETNSKYSSKVSYKTGVWTPGQCVINVRAGSFFEAVELYEQNAAQIIAHIENVERERIIKNNEEYTTPELRHEVSKVFGGSPAFPSDAKMFKQTDDFMWISIYNTDFVKKYILMYKYPVENAAKAMEAESIISHNKAVMNENMPGMQENSFMTHSTFYPPTVEMIEYNGREIAEIRGLWDVENDYMGGPFVGHEFLSADGKEMIGVTGFVYAPKYDKLPYIREVEAIVYSFEWDESKK